MQNANVACLCHWYAGACGWDWARFANSKLNQRGTKWFRRSATNVDHYSCQPSPWSFPSNHIWRRQFQTSWLDLFLGQYIFDLTFISIFWSYKPNLLYFCKLQTWQCQVLTRYIIGLSVGRHDTRDETGEIGRNLCKIFLHLVVEALFRARLTQNPFYSCVTLLFFRNSILGVFVLYS